MTRLKADYVCFGKNSPRHFASIRFDSLSSPTDYSNITLYHVEFNTGLPATPERQEDRSDQEGDGAAVFLSQWSQDILQES